MSTPAAKDADPVTQVAIAVPTPVTGNAPLDPAYADEEMIYSIVSKKQRSVALETGSFIALNEEAVKLPIHDRAVAALLDSGAQRSLITKDAVDRCGFTIKAIEPATLQGFDNDTPKNKNYKVAEVIMGKVGKKPVVLDALVINKINSIQMTGICALAKKVASPKAFFLLFWDRSFQTFGANFDKIQTHFEEKKKSEK